MDRGSQLDEEDEEDEDDKDDEEDEEDEEEEEDEEDEDEDARKRKRKRKATNIKSNNPHLAGGEKIYIGFRWFQQLSDGVLDIKHSCIIPNIGVFATFFFKNISYYIISHYI